MAFNAWMETLHFRIPPAPQGRPWRRVVDTALASPLDIVGPNEGPRVEVGATYPVVPFSTVVLIAEA
jgi:isoamylase